MRINDTRKGRTIAEVLTGGVFMYEGDYYMKTEVISDEDCNPYNAVNLYSGELSYFAVDGDQIEPVCATLTIE